MSDLMLFGVLQMPYDMAMGDEFSRRQFYDRVQQAVALLKAGGRDATIEEAAKVAENTICGWNDYGDIYGEDAAEAIRALKSPPTERQGGEKT